MYGIVVIYNLVKYKFPLVPIKTLMGMVRFSSTFTVGIIFILLYIFKDVEAVNVNAVINIISLPNEYCRVRPTLINVGQSVGDYYPMIITLYRCVGTCGKEIPKHTKCYAASSSKVYVNAFNPITSFNETLMFDNHTSCACACVHNDTVCSETQVWDDTKCICVCGSSNSFSICPLDYIWNPRYCKCECDKICNYRQLLNKTTCSCECKKKYYKRCNRKNKVLREDDCRCYVETSRLTQKVCNTLPTKWATIIIIISVCAIIILASDLIFYCKGVGFVYRLIQLCLRDEGNIEMRSQQDVNESFVNC